MENRTLDKSKIDKRALGKTGMDVSILGFGAAEIGYRGVPSDTVARLINGALDAGLNVIDTAECYPSSEEKIGETAAHRRDEFFLFTKCGHEGDGDNWNPKKMAQQIDRSLERLKTDRVDLLQLHSCTEEQLRQGDVIDVIRRARDAGKARFLGYSGDGQAALHAVESGAFDTLQISVSIADQESIDLAMPAAKAKGMGVIAKRPIANAIWAQTSKPDAYYQPYWERFHKLDYDFLKADMQQAVSIALRFTLAVDGVHTAIVGTTHPERWRQNAALLQAGPLDSHQFQAIRSRWKSVAMPGWVGQV
jgi:aryl-alcohol dehydrogenase-like predicted oxidoreductase